MLSLAEEWVKFRVSWGRIRWAWETIPYVAHLVESGWALITGLIAQRPWNDEFDESISSCNQLFSQTPNPKRAKWLNATPWRGLHYPTFWKADGSGEETSGLTPALTFPKKLKVKTVGDVTFDHLVAAGFCNSNGEPWMSEPHGCKNKENLFELLYCRMPCGSSYRRHLGHIGDHKVRVRQAILRNLYKGGGCTPFDPKRFIGNGFAYDGNYIFYESFAQIENLMIAVYIDLVLGRNKEQLFGSLPSGFKPLGEYQYWTCCTGHNESRDPNVTNLKPTETVEACWSWLKEEMAFYGPGWYNTASIGYVVAESDDSYLVLAKNMWSVVALGLCAKRHADYDWKLPLGTFVGISRKRDWGDHFTSWLHVIDDSSQLGYFQGSAQNAIYVEAGTMISDIVARQNDLAYWTGPEADNLLKTGCSNNHHMSRKQERCRVCEWSKTTDKAVNFADLKALMGPLLNDVNMFMTRVLVPLNQQPDWVAARWRNSFMGGQQFTLPKPATSPTLRSEWPHEFDVVRDINFMGLGGKTFRCRICLKQIEVGHFEGNRKAAARLVGSCSPTK